MGWIETECGLQDITPKLCIKIQSLPHREQQPRRIQPVNAVWGGGGIATYFGKLSQHTSTKGWEKMQGVWMSIHVVHVVTAGLQVVRYKSNFLPHMCILRVKLVMYTRINKNPSAWNFLSPKPEMTCVTVAIIIRIVLLPPYLPIRAVSLSSIHYNQSHRVYINRRRQYICLIWN